MLKTGTEKPEHKAKSNQKQFGTTQIFSSITFTEYIQSETEICH